MAALTIPSAFIWRRIHSLMGLWLVLFLTEHLITNSQAALWLGSEGQGFVRMVNALHNLPYLEVIELTLIGVPLLIHMAWGVRYALSSKMNHRSGDGSTPSIQTGRNRAYSWQRITSWILLLCLLGHIVKFRIMEYPERVDVHNHTYYAVTLTADAKLEALSERLQVILVPHASTLRALAPDFGTATLLSVRDTFKNPIYVGLYTIFVLVACFHAFNGFWTFLITWGWVLKMAAQRAWSTVAVCLIALFIFLGLAAVWGSYWIQL